MKCFHVLSIALLVIACGWSVAPAQEAEQSATFAEQLEEWLPGIGAEKIADRRDSQQKLQNAVFQLGTPGREAELTAACKAIVEKLGPDTAQPARIWLLRQLEFSGGAECVDAVAALLGDKDARIRETARRALQNNPAKTANDKLLAALAGGGDGAWRAALANALGARRDAASAGALAKLLSDKDQAVAGAAASALGKVTGPEATGALKAAVGKVSGPLQAQVADAYLRCADALLKAGKRAEATQIYKEMTADDLPKAVRLAGKRGLLNSASR